MSTAYTPTSRPVRSIWWTYLVAGVVACFAGLLVVQVTPQSERPFLYFGLIVMTLGTAVYGCFRGYRQHGYFDFMSPFVLMPLMYAVIYGIGAANYEDSAKFADGQWLLWLLLLGFIGYIGGVIWMTGILAWRTSTTSTDTQSVRSHDRDYTTAANVAMAIGLIAMIAYWGHSGGIPILQPNLENSRVAALSGEGIPFYLSMLVMPAVWLRYRTISGRLNLSQMGLCAFAALVLVSTGWRNTAVALVFVAVIIRHYKRPFAARRLAAFGGGLVLVISVVGLYRVYSSGIANYETYQKLHTGNYVGAFWAYIQTYPASFTQAFATVINGVPGQMPFQGGRSFYWNFQLLSLGHHPPPFDFLLKESLHVGFSGGGLPPTLVGEFYLNFGVTGIVAGLMVIGAVCAYVHHRLTQHGVGNLSAVLAAVILYYLSVSVRGGLGDVSITLVWLALVITLLHFVSPRVDSDADPRRATAKRSASPDELRWRAPSGLAGGLQGVEHRTDWGR